LVPFVSYGENKVLQKQALIFGANIKTTFQVCKQTNALGVYLFYVHGFITLEKDGKLQEN
jgi:hypothetical protein